MASDAPNWNEESKSSSSTNLAKVSLNCDSDNAVIFFPEDSRVLKFLLECPICTEYMIGIVRMCIMGHSMCGSCFTKVSKSNSMNAHCPLCRKCLSPYSARNYMLESLAAVCRFACKFMDRGCDKLLEGHHFKIHLLECPFRYLGCQNSLEFNGDETRTNELKFTWT